MNMYTGLSNRERLVRDAIRQQHCKSVRRLLRDRGYCYMEGERRELLARALLWAVESGSVVLTHIVLENGACPGRPFHGKLAIVVAGQLRERTVFDFLVRTGVSVDGDDSFSFWESGSVPLFVAIEAGAERAAERLIRAGCRVNGAALWTWGLSRGSTFLHVAVANGTVRTAWLLLQHGADVLAKDADGNHGNGWVVFGGNI